MIIKLQPCPFCGGRAGYSKVPQQGFSVLCRNCGAIAMHDYAPGRDDIAAGWNRRAAGLTAYTNSRMKPCPFCGAQIPAGGFAAGGDIVRCPSCGMMVSFAGASSIHDTIQLWNIRGGEVPPPGSRTQKRRY